VCCRPKTSAAILLDMAHTKGRLDKEEIEQGNKKLE
jgi:hypothetical protein